MISKKIYVLIFAFVYSFAFSCSSGDDEIDQNTEIPEESPNNTHTNNPQKPDDISESTDYIVTDEIKTITLDSKSKQEYLIYKDYYWKHKIYLDGTNICFNSYYGGGEGWNLRNYGRFIINNITLVYEIRVNLPNLVKYQQILSILIMLIYPTTHLNQMIRGK